MKEAFWGVLIVTLGLFGIVVVNVFQKVTVVNDQTYYLLKETTEASAYDAIDLTYYRLRADVRVVKEKFVENFVRRFAENVTNYSLYEITVQEMNETPPRMTIKIKTSITSLQGDPFGITNKIDAIIETKYTIKDITDFLGITEEEWINRDVGKTDACSVTTIGSDEQECITGDLEFVSWEEDKIPETTCSTDVGKADAKEATYKACECGKWSTKTVSVTPTIINSGIEYIYNWNLKVDGDIRDINETTKKRAYFEKCTTGIEIYVPKDLRVTEPSSDNSAYELCPGGGTTVNQGQTIVLHANYIPSDSSNRNVTWTNSDNSKITLQSTNPYSDTGYSKAAITGKELGTTIVTAKTTNGKTATCKVTVLDGYADSVSCGGGSVQVGSSITIPRSYLPYTATKTTLNWSSSNTGVATINSGSGVAYGVSKGSSTITVQSTNPLDKTTINGTCGLTVNPKPGGSSTKAGDSCSCSIYDVIYTTTKTVCPGTEYGCIQYTYYKGKKYPYYSVCCTKPWEQQPDPHYGTITKTGTTITQSGPSSIFDGQCYTNVSCKVTKSDGTIATRTISWTYYPC